MSFGAPVSAAARITHNYILVLHRAPCGDQPNRVVLATLWISRFLFRLRFDPLHQRDEREHSPAGRLVVREDHQHQLGGGVQVAHLHAPPHGLRQRGELPRPAAQSRDQMSTEKTTTADCYVLITWKTLFPLIQRFVQYLASRNTLFNLSNFLDKSGLQGKNVTAVADVRL